MKLTQANGKVSVKLSYNDWLSIGKKAGWTAEAQPQMAPQHQMATDNKCKKCLMNPVKADGLCDTCLSLMSQQKPLPSKSNVNTVLPSAKSAKSRISKTASVNVQQILQHIYDALVAERRALGGETLSASEIEDIVKWVNDATRDILTSPPQQPPVKSKPSGGDFDGTLDMTERAHRKPGEFM